MLSGYVKSVFFEALVKREKSVSTYVGAGISLPHCVKEHIDLVITSEFQIFQFPQGVSLGDSKVVFIVVAVAAKLDEHLDILVDIADLLGDELKTTQLAQATNVADFIKKFGQPSLSVTPAKIKENVITESRINHETGIVYGCSGRSLFSSDAG